MMPLNIKELTAKKCQPCSQGAVPLSSAEAGEYLARLPEWVLASDEKNISREYVMKNFIAAIQLIHQIAEVAESEDHHPDLHLTGYRRLRIDLATHSIGGLSLNDFILAAKIDQLPKELKK
ncbi:MAG: 4a-hydroxytetrahydrobiopterin dehydratase [Candidatus Omnitrophica bacterium]|nr:4a-hydroxytetrahydrobiopterin dehydratase [Candidatus Omnitrophota bacterium]